MTVDLIISFLQSQEFKAFEATCLEKGEGSFTQEFPFLNSVMAVSQTYQNGTLRKSEMAIK